MKTLKKIKDIVIEAGKYIARKPLEAILITTLSAAPIACKNGHDPIIYIPNNPPVVTSTPVTEAIENELYSYDVDADDPEGEPLTYSFLDSPIGMTIESDTGLIQWTPLDADASQSHNIEVKIDDGKKFTTQSFSVYAKDKSTITFNIKNVTDDTDLSGMEIIVGTNTADTNGTGVATLVDILEGEYQVEINDKTGAETNYLTYKAGKLISNKNKKDLGKLDNLVLKVIPATLNQDFKREILYWDEENSQLGPIRKWENNKPSTIYFWTIDFPTGNPLVPAEVIEVTNLINELSQFSQDATGLNVVVSDIEPPWLSDGYMIVWADSSMIQQGSNGSILDGDKIIYCSVKFKPSVSKGVKRQELTEGLIDGGESNLELSVLNEPLIVFDYTAYDLNMGKIFDNRPIGSEDKNIADNHDVTPLTYIINP